VTAPNITGPGRLRRRDERGTSLVELAVVLLLIGIVLPTLLGFVLAVQKEENFVQSRAAASGAAMPMTDTISKQLHTAIVVSSATPAFTAVSGANAVEFYASLGNGQGPTEVEIMTQACSSCRSGIYNLVEKTAAPTNYAWGSTVVLGSGIVPPTASPTTDCPSSGTFTPGIFEFLDGSGKCLPLSGGTLPASELPEVDSVVVHLTTIDASRGSSSPQTTFMLHISLPNVEYWNEIHG
jgi:hypothetical protein